MVKQCEFLDINRSGMYYERRRVSPEDEEIMKKIDRTHMKYPFKGSRRIVYALGKMEGVEIRRKRVIRLMEIRGLAPLGLRGEGHRIYPYCCEGRH